MRADNPISWTDLGRRPYAQAYEIQLQEHARVLASRSEKNNGSAQILTVVHDPVITVTKRPDAPGHVLGSRDDLNAMGVTIEETDRGGDVTYHGPGQLVCYPIVDLNAYSLRIHDYIRLLEQCVIDTLASFGLEGVRDPDATGVWVERDGELAKIAAIGVRVRKWISLHGLALNVDPNMSHFGLIVPCGLAGRPVCSLKELLGNRAPGLADVQTVLVDSLRTRLSGLIETHDQASQYSSQNP